MKRFAHSAFLGAVFAALPHTAFAYLDPGTGSMILSAVIGGIAAGFYVARKWFYNLKNRLFGKTDRHDA